MNLKMWTSKYFVCLECEKEFENKKNLAICPSCLEKARENFKKGIRSHYETVNMFLEKVLK